MPSPRPVKPSFSLVVALTATRLSVDAGERGDVCAHGVAMRPDARGLAHDVDIDMGDAAAARGEALEREGDEPVGRGAAPLRIARRKMHADVAVGERAEDGVGQRVQDHVGVGMAGERLRSCGILMPPRVT